MRAVSDDEAPVLTVTFRDGFTSFLIGLAVVYWLANSAMGMLTAILGPWSIAPLFALACLIGIGLALWFASYSVQVGRDGVYLGRWRARRFIPVSEILSVQERRTARGVLEGFHIILRAKPSVTVALKRPEQAETLKARIERAVAASRGDGAGALAQLSRGGRSLETWKKELAVLANGGGFRAAATSFDDLDRVLHDPAATPEHRIAAALALRSRAEPHTRNRIRIAAEASVHPKVRVALSELAEGRDADAAVEAALADDALEPDVGARLLS
jgi:hypothetical protein